jgi:uncharacterized protein
MNPEQLLLKYYQDQPELFNVILTHSKQVTKKALEIAKNVPELHPDLEFIKEAALLHDIGIFLVYAPKIGATGKKSYLWHGLLGHDILEKEGLSKHAKVALRHTGVGITKADVVKQNLSLPSADYVAETIEEEIISLADLFYSKSGDLLKAHSVDSIRKNLSRFGEEKVAIFDSWIKKYKL